MRATPPLSTYRLQLTPAFGFDAAAAVVPYLADLGVTHVYCSPYLQAAPGSTHGYDVVDHRRVNDELGGTEAHARFVKTLEQHGLGQVLDIVPNHMAITGPENVWWWDVLENGPASVYASYFDVDWDPPESKLRNRVLLPVLGDHYGRVLDAGDIRVERDGGTFTVRYHEQAAPVAPRSLDDLLARAGARCGSAELESLATAFGRLPPATATDRASVEERHRDKEVLRAQVGRLAEEDHDVAATLDAVVAELNADPDALDALLERQNYRLSYWRTAGEELDYRRFFDVTGLAGLRVEDELVFADTHALILRWVREGLAHGLRVDHPDGLRDPAAYLARLAEATNEVWVVVEKILEPGEHLPPWPVAGTTGYDVLNQLTGLFVAREAEAPLTALYAEVTGRPTDFDEVAAEQKRRVLRHVLAADLERVTAAFVLVCEGRRRYRDYTRAELRDVLAEVVAAFPVYRTYVDARTATVSADDAAHVSAAIGAAQARRPDLDGDLLGFLADVVLLRVQGDREAELVARFQQLTGPAMAKGVEDTAFYTYNRFVALNEVGGAPGRFGVDVAGFHAANEEAAAATPSRMVTTSTHDTKRSADVRARLSLLSQMPGDWTVAVRRWLAMNERHRTAGAPDRNTEYLLYQTLVGAWPLPVDRALAYMEKATREAKVHTSWVDPDSAFDDAVRRFVEGVLADAEFTDDLAAFVGPLVVPGRTVALAQALLGLTVPGVADVYQGNEVWDLSLVDPDNRRAVDFDARAALLGDLAGLTSEQVLARAEEGMPKLLVTQRALQLRRSRPDLLGPGAAYRRLDAGDGWVAFERGGAAITVVPRFPLRPADDATIELAAGRWRNVLTDDALNGGRVATTELTRRFPVALLVKQ